MRTKLDLVPGLDKPVAVLLQQGRSGSDMLREWVWTWVAKLYQLRLTKTDLVLTRGLRERVLLRMAGIWWKSVVL